MINRDALEEFCKKAGGELNDTGAALVCKLDDATIAYIYDDMMQPLEITTKTGKVTYLTTQDSLDCEVEELKLLGNPEGVTLSCRSSNWKDIDNRIEVAYSFRDHTTNVNYNNYKYGYDPFWKREHPIHIAEIHF